MRDLADLQETFRTRGLRLTYQRKVILDILRKTKSHPVAASVYEEARRKIPNISLGTVYRNLNVLREHRMIQELDFGRGHSRYDGDTSPHYHVMCVRCERLEDVDIPVMRGINERAEKSTGYRVVQHRMEFLGICPRCAGK